MPHQIPYLEFDGTGPLLHFAHANAYPPGSYRRFLTDLAADYHVLAMHQRPLWPNQQPEQLTSWQLFADDLVAFLHQQNLQGIIGVGHSLGAVATMKAAIQEPSLFSHLVLIEPVFLPAHHLEKIAAHPEKVSEFPLVEIARKRRFRWPNRPAAFNHYRAKTVFEGWTDEILWDYINHGLIERNGGVELWFSREWESQIYSTIATDVWQQVPHIKQPTLAIRACDSDTLFPPAWSLWQELQPEATFLEVEDTTHLLLMERPDQVADLVLDFLEREEVTEATS